ncbi:hypothetical protein SLA2020_129270 [Shorea laevis]
MHSFPKHFSGRTRPSRSTVLIVSCLLLFALSAFIFALTAFFDLSDGGHRCRTAYPRSVKVVWDRKSNAGNEKKGNDGENALGDGNGVKRHKVMAFVGIQTGFGSTGRRRSLRKTWMPSDRQGLQRLEEATGLAFRFVIGRTNDKSKMAELRKEVAEYDDFMLLDIEEYSKLPYKTLAFFKAAYALFDSEFYVKADDDIYLRPERSHSQTYLGCMKKGPVFTDPKLKWYEPLSDWLGKEYFLHANGHIYALSADVVTSLVSLRNNTFRMFSNEDVTIGAWMLAMNVNHENSRELCEVECTPSSIALWDFPKCSGLCDPENRLLELHQKEICSGSPTLESDE